MVDNFHVVDVLYRDNEDYILKIIDKNYGLIATREIFKLKDRNDNIVLIKKNLNAFIAKLSLFKKLLFYKPRILHIHFLTNVKFCILPLILYKIVSLKTLKISIYIHGYDTNVAPSKSILYFIFLKFLCNYANYLTPIKIISPSMFLIKKIKRFGSNFEISVQPHEINQIFAKNKSLREFSSNLTLNILTIARINKCKGIDLIIDLAKAFKEKGMRINFSIVGSCEDKILFEKLRQGIYEYKNLKYFDYMSPPALVEFMKDFHLYLQPSVITEQGDQESFGLAAAEAAANGMPLIVTNIGGLSERVVNLETGIISEPDFDSLFKSINLFYNKANLIKSFSVNLNSSFNEINNI